MGNLGPKIKQELRENILPKKYNFVKNRNFSKNFG